jgi:hypothetical protein
MFSNLVRIEVVGGRTPEQLCRVKVNDVLDAQE